MATMTIDGQDYDTETLSADANKLIISVQVTDQKIAELQTQMAIYQTARTAYAQELLTLLPQRPVS